MAITNDPLEIETLEKLQALLRRFGPWLLALLLLLAILWGGNAGWNAWQDHKAQQAAVIFDEVLQADKSEDAAKALAAFNTLRQQFSSSLFTAQAALISARLNAAPRAAKNSPNAPPSSGSAASSAPADLAQAEAALRWLMAAKFDRSFEAEYHTIARLRLAALLMQQKKPAEALSLLESKTPVPKSFQGLMDDRRGDALFLLGRREEARNAYAQAAQNFLPQQQAYASLTGVKLEALGGTPQSAEPAPTAATTSATPAAPAAPAAR